MGVSGCDVCVCEEGGTGPKGGSLQGKPGGKGERE